MHFGMESIPNQAPCLIPVFAIVFVDFFNFLQREWNKYDSSYRNIINIWQSCCWCWCLPFVYQIPSRSTRDCIDFVSFVMCSNRIRRYIHHDAHPSPLIRSATQPIRLIMHTKNLDLWNFRYICLYLQFIQSSHNKYCECMPLVQRAPSYVRLIERSNAYASVAAVLDVNVGM